MFLVLSFLCDYIVDMVRHYLKIIDINTGIKAWYLISYVLNYFSCAIQHNSTIVNAAK